MARVLIVGGTRFVGYQLAWRLVAGGHQVTLLNRGNREDPFGDRVERLRADRSSRAFVEALATKTFDACVDFACYTEADAALAVEALGGRVGHYIMISTGQVYLVRPGCPRPAREADYDGPVMPEPHDQCDREEWAYGVGKRKAEDLLASSGSTLPTTRLRIPMVNGERDHYRRIENYLWRMLDGGPIVVPDGGRHPIRHVYGGSVVDAVVALLGNSKTFGEAYNLAQRETPTLRELLALLALRLGASLLLVDVPTAAVRGAGLVPVDVSPFSGSWMSFLDPSKAVRELGFAHTPLQAYLATIVTCFLNHPPNDYPPSYARRAEEIRLASGYSS